MGAAWRDVKDNAQFDRVLDMVRQVNDLGLEVCATLGMLTADQARRLDEAGLYAYNHNLDTSPEYYDSVITTRTYQERLDTIDNLRTTSITVCCGGIIGMGESVADRISFLHRLATLDPHPESVPINVLSRVPGTPLEDAADVEIDETVRMIAVARLLMPASVVRIAAGRHLMSFSDQALCFLAGANSIFTSERNMMLTETTPCADHASDRADARRRWASRAPRVLEPSDVARCRVDSRWDGVSCSGLAVRGVAQAGLPGRDLARADALERGERPARVGHDPHVQHRHRAGLRRSRAGTVPSIVAKPASVFCIGLSVRQRSRARATA